MMLHLLTDGKQTSRDESTADKGSNPTEEGADKEHPVHARTFPAL
jgi:hypothetical protein